MKAILIKENGNLVLSEVEKPAPKANEILIKIHATALNRADLLQRKGTYPSPEGWPDWMGLEVSGTVEDMGEEAAQKCNFKINDKVCALLGGGGYAEYICVPYGLVMSMPKNLSFYEAAALPEVCATSYLNLFIEGHLKSGDTVYIPAGASGLASMAIPMAKAFGAYVVTSVLSDEIAEKISYLGADIIIDSKKQSVPQVFKELSESGRPVKVVMDCLSGKTIGECLPYVADGAYWVVISTLDGTETNIPLRSLLTKGVHLVGSMLRKRSNEEKSQILKSLVDDVWPKIEDGTIKPSIYKVLPLADAEEAHGILERSEHTGKVVLKVCD